MKWILIKKQVYDCLTFDVTNHALLKAKLKSAYPSKSGFIERTFNDYGF